MRNSENFSNKIQNIKILQIQMIQINMTQVKQMSIKNMQIFVYSKLQKFSQLFQFLILLTNFIIKTSQNITFQMGKSTVQTAIAIANSSIGSAMIIFPLNYLKYGIIQNLVFLLLMGLILATTCSVFGMHLRPSETEITQTVKRILGEKYFKAAALLSGILLTLVSNLFFLLASDILYDVFVEIIGEFSLSQKLFKLILMFFFTVLLLPKKLDMVFKAAPYALGSLIISTLVLISSFPLNLSSLDKGAFELKQFSLEGLLLVASINGFAFTCHPSISPMLKSNEDQKSNKKAIYLGFAISCILYFVVGVCGSLAIYGKHPIKTSNVMDYFSGNWQAPLIGITNFIYFIMIFPIFPFVAKKQFIILISEENKKLPLFVGIGFIIIWLILNTFFVLSESSPGKLMGFIGSVVAFYFTYLLPCMIMLKAGKSLYIDRKVECSRQNIEQSLLKDETIVFSYKDMEKKETIITNQQSTYNQIQNKNRPLDNQTIYDKGYTIKHQSLDLKDKIIYCLILLVGVVLFVSSIIDTIQKF